jgi:transketolase
MTNALSAADKLNAAGVSCAVASFHTIKPLDEEFLKASISKFELIATVEEHGKIGGLGGAIAEFISQYGVHPKLIRIGVEDEFMHEMGTQEYARKKYSLDPDGISEKIKANLV